MENFDNIPSNSLKVEVEHLINALNSNAGLYDSDEVLAALYTLRQGIRKSSERNIDNVAVSEIALWALENSPDALGDFLDVSDTELATLKENIKQQQLTGLKWETP